MWDDWDDDEPREPMTDAEYEVWLVEMRAKLARSLADPRPSLTPEQVRKHLAEHIRRLYAKDKDAAA